MRRKIYHSHYKYSYKYLAWYKGEGVKGQFSLIIATNLPDEAVRTYRTAKKKYPYTLWSNEALHQLLMGDIN